jgi:hypothetical protein
MDEGKTIITVEGEKETRNPYKVVKGKVESLEPKPEIMTESMCPASSSVGAVRQNWLFVIYGSRGLSVRYRATVVVNLS